MSDIDRVAGMVGARVAATPVGRRTLMGSIAALSMVGIAETPAFAAASSTIKTFRGRFGIHGGAIINGYFAAPRGRSELDTIVVLPGKDSLPARTQAVAARYAAAGYLAIAPDLAATYRGGAFPSRDKMIADFSRQLPNLKRMPLSNGSIRVVIA